MRTAGHVLRLTQLVNYENADQIQINIGVVRSTLYIGHCSYQLLCDIVLSTD